MAEDDPNSKFGEAKDAVCASVVTDGEVGLLAALKGIHTDDEEIELMVLVIVLQEVKAMELGDDIVVENESVLSVLEATVLTCNRPADGSLVVEVVDIVHVEDGL